MEINISDSIRRLRKEKNMTQEMLAARLQITPQSVSKWERGDGYPDITILPSLANCLDVSIDVLLGNDKIIAEERINNYISEYKRLTASEETWHSAFTVAKNAYEEFAYDYRIMMLYVNAINIFRPIGFKDEIEHICKIVLQNCDDHALCADASYHICGFRDAYDRMAFLDKYVSYGQDWNWFKVYSHDSEEGKIMMQYEIFDKWWFLNSYIYEYGDLMNEHPERKITHKEKIQLIKKCEKIFHAVFDDEDLGEFTFYIGQYNEFLSREYAALGKKDEALQHFEKAVDGWVLNNNLPDDFEYKNILFDHRPYIRENYSGTYTYLSRYRKDIDANSDYDILRDDDRFKTAYAKLCENH